jgi:hypothetical protein
MREGKAVLPFPFRPLWLQDWIGWDQFFEDTVEMKSESGFEVFTN